MQNHRLILYTIGFCASFASACKKKNNTEGSSCKITNIQDNLNNSTITIAITYDGEGRLASEHIVNPDGTATQKVFQYSGNTELITTSHSGTTTKDSVILNSAGLAEADYYSGQEQILTTYAYSGNEVQTGTIQPVSGGSPTSSTYNWSNGNIVSSVINNNAPGEGYIYDTTKPAQTGDYWNLLTLESYGYTFMQNTNLLTGSTTSSNGTIYPFEKFTYTFDEGNKITQLVTTFGAAVETTDYKYDCND
jgi:YD repeat-containing protein